LIPQKEKLRLSAEFVTECCPLLLLEPVHPVGFHMTEVKRGSWLIPVVMSFVIPVWGKMVPAIFVINLQSLPISFLRRKAGQKLKAFLQKISFRRLIQWYVPHQIIQHLKEQERKDQD